MDTEISLSKCYRAKRRAKVKIYGDVRDQFRRFITVIKTNYDSCVKIYTSAHIERARKTEEGQLLVRAKKDHCIAVYVC